jgi:hypothetical protein
MLGLAAAPLERAAPSADESVLFTPPGFTREGQVARVSGENSGRLEIHVRDAATGRFTACRLNVVGPDGNYYQPETNCLAPYGLTSEWPKAGAWGNRREKGPYRYLGRFFYTTGAVEVAVPPGQARLEAAKGFEFAPTAQTIEIAAGQAKAVELLLTRTADASQFGYFGGDPHFHFPRRTDQDDNTMLALLAAEDLHFGALLAYNEPMGPYAGLMEKLDSPQLRGLGLASVRERDGYALISGQEYRSTTYGHLLLYLRDGLVFPAERFNADDWPVFGEVAREVQSAGGLAIQAHGGYAQEVYADGALGTVKAVELLQFGIYRGLGLADWYDMLNTGYRFPITAASDWPACRFLGDCRTFVRAKARPSFPDWLRGAAEGRSFVSSGPLLLLELDGQGPGARFDKAGPGPHTATARLRLRCEVTPVTHAQLIVNGQVVQTWTVPAGQQQGAWWEAERRLELREPSWIAARAWSTTPAGQPDAEAHTNPVYVYLGGRAPYRRASLETWLARIEGQLSVHRQRDFAEKAKVLAYFEQARDTLLRIREHGGLGADECPANAAGYATATTVQPAGKASAPQSGDAKPSVEGRVSRVGKAAVPPSGPATPAGFAQPEPPKPPAEAITLQPENDYWLDNAVLSSARDGPAKLLTLLLADTPATLNDRRLGFCERAAESAGQRNVPAELKQALMALATAPALRETPDVRVRLAFTVGRGLKRAGARLSAQDEFGPTVAQLLDEARQCARRTALDERLAQPERVRAIEQLGCLTLERVHEPLSRLLDAKGEAVQIAALRAIADYTEPLATEILLHHWRQNTPAVRVEEFQAMLRYEERTLAWLRAAERGEVSLAAADRAERQSLLHHRNAEVARLARRVLGHAQGDDGGR